MMNMPRFKISNAPKFKGSFRTPTFTRLMEWIYATESWSRANRRTVWAWKRAHGWKHVRRLIDGKNQRVWLHPEKRLLPNYLGGQVVITIDKVTRSADRSLYK